MKVIWSFNGFKRGERLFKLFYIISPDCSLVASTFLYYLVRKLWKENKRPQSIPLVLVFILFFFFFVISHFVWRALWFFQTKRKRERQGDKLFRYPKLFLSVAAGWAALFFSHNFILNSRSLLKTDLYLLSTLIERKHWRSGARYDLFCFISVQIPQATTFRRPNLFWKWFFISSLLIKMETTTKSNTFRFWLI